MAYFIFSVALLFAFIAFVWLRNQHLKILEGKPVSTGAKKAPETRAESRKTESKQASAEAFLVVAASHDTKVTLKKDGQTVKRSTNGSLSLHIKEGNYTIEILYPSSFKAVREISVKGGETYEFHVNSGILKVNYEGKPSRVACELKLLSSKHSFTGKFRKMIDRGENIFVLPEGRYEIELTANGNYIPFKTTVDVKPKNETVVSAAVLQPGTLDFSTQNGARIFVDNKAIGEMGSIKPIKVDPGRHIVRILFPSGFDYRESVEIKSGSRTTVRVDVEKVKFRMLAGPQVARLDLSLNGKRSGGKLRVELPLNRTLVLTLPTGNYTYTIDGAGYHQVKGVFNLKTGKPLTIEEKLRQSRKSRNNRQRRYNKGRKDDTRLKRNS